MEKIIEKAIKKVKERRENLTQTREDFFQILYNLAYLFYLFNEDADKDQVYYHTKLEKDTIKISSHDDYYPTTYHLGFINGEFGLWYHNDGYNYYPVEEDEVVYFNPEKALKQLEAFLEDVANNLNTFKEEAEKLDKLVRFIDKLYNLEKNKREQK